MPRMALLSADGTFVSALGRSTLVRLDDVTGRRFGGVGRVLLEASDLILELPVVCFQLADLTLELGIGLFQSKHVGAKQVDLQNQLRYRDILVYHGQGHILLPRIAPVQKSPAPQILLAASRERLPRDKAALVAPPWAWYCLCVV